MIAGIIIGILIAILFPVILVILSLVGITIVALWEVCKVIFVAIVPFVIIGVIVGYFVGKGKK